MSRESIGVLLAAALMAAVSTMPTLAQEPSPATSPPAGSSSPAPSFIGAPDLEALFPTTIDGEPVTIQSFGGADMRSLFQGDEAGSVLLTVALDAVGKTLDDLSVANGWVATPDGLAVIIALRVADTDPADLIDGFAALMLEYDSIDRTDMELGDKSVQKLVPDSDGPSAEPVYAYAAGEVLWLVMSQQPLLGHVFASLP